jgi:hypothetical protein
MRFYHESAGRWDGLKIRQMDRPPVSVHAHCLGKQPQPMIRRILTQVLVMAFGVLSAQDYSVIVTKLPREVNGVGEINQTAFTPDDGATGAPRAAFRIRYWQTGIHQFSAYGLMVRESLTDATLSRRSSAQFSAAVFEVSPVLFQAMDTALRREGRVSSYWY